MDEVELAKSVKSNIFETSPTLVTAAAVNCCIATKVGMSRPSSPGKKQERIDG